LIGRRGPYPGACSGKFTTPENVVTYFPDQGMDLASIINFLSNEDTQELAPRFFISSSRWFMGSFQGVSASGRLKTPFWPPVQNYIMPACLR
jgi:hypothetical protein